MVHWFYHHLELSKNQNCTQDLNFLDLFTPHKCKRMINTAFICIELIFGKNVTCNPIILIMAQRTWLYAWTQKTEKNVITKTSGLGVSCTSLLCPWVFGPCTATVHLSDKNVHYHSKLFSTILKVLSSIVRQHAFC